MRTLRLFGLSALLLVVAAGACSTDEGSEDAGPSDDVPPVTLVDAGEFAERMDQPGVVTINVHVPDEGTIAGTDMTIPFDQIATTDELPTDTDTPLAIYCKSGNMSADAAKDLQALGYTDVVELRNGFEGWVESGRPLESQ